MPHVLTPSRTPSPPPARMLQQRVPGLRHKGANNWALIPAWHGNSTTKVLLLQVEAQQQARKPLPATGRGTVRLVDSRVHSCAPVHPPQTTLPTRTCLWSRYPACQNTSGIIPVLHGTQRMAGYGCLCAFQLCWIDADAHPYGVLAGMSQAASRTCEIEVGVCCSVVWVCVCVCVMCTHAADHPKRPATPHSQALAHPQPHIPSHPPHADELVGVAQ